MRWKKLIVFGMSAVYSGSRGNTQEAYADTDTKITREETYPSDATATFENTSSTTSGGPPDTNYVGGAVAREEQIGVPRGQGGTYSGQYTEDTGTPPDTSSTSSGGGGRRGGGRRGGSRTARGERRFQGTSTDTTTTSEASRAGGGTYGGNYATGAATDNQVGGYPDHRDENGNAVS